jgi:hypothetical protein
MASKLSVIAGLLLAFAPAGCQKDKFDPRKKLAELDAGVAASALPPGFRLDLPTAPIVVKRPTVPVQYPDGSYSVQGLFSRRRDLLNKEVRVTGYVVEIHAQKEPKEGPYTPPHLYLADDSAPKEDARRLLVSDFTVEQAKEVQPGERFRVRGNYQITSRSRFSRTEGVISFKGIETP